MTVLFIGLTWLLAPDATVARAEVGKNLPKAKGFRIERSMPKEAVVCIGCHKAESPGVFADWARL